MLNSRAPQGALVTVITVTHNAQRYIERTMESVFAQDYDRIEYIVIDGESSDETVTIIKKYEGMLSDWCSEKDDSVYDAMNKGIARAHGDWLIFLNAGDMFCSPGVVSRVMSEVEVGTDIICGDVIHVADGSDRRTYRKAPGLETIWKPLAPSSHQAAFIRRELMLNNPYSTRYKISADYEFFLKAYLAKAKYQFVDFAICDFLIGGMSARNQILGRAESVNVLVEHMEDPKEFARQDGFVRAFDHLTNRGSTVATEPMTFMEGVRAVVCQLDVLKKPGLRVVVYGNGTLGRLVAKYIASDVLVTIADMFDHDEEFDGLPVHHPADLDPARFDYVFITVVGRETEIADYLRNEVGFEVQQLLSLGDI